MRECFIVDSNSQNVKQWICIYNKLMNDSQKVSQNVSLSIQTVRIVSVKQWISLYL